MASHTTQPYKQTLSGSIGAGMGSLFAPGGRKYYILEHRVTSKYHKAGESQQIIVDNIEIGRDSRCQVRFDERFTTVSRHHAGIVKDGDGWKLVQISKTNSTLLNGHPVKTEWYLQNGDEIQFSINGPKLGFIIPTGKKSTVGSIGLTRRLSLFRQQALRPYKTAITALACCLVLAIAGLGCWNFALRNDLAAQSAALADQIIQAEGNRQLVDSLSRKLVEANKQIAENLDKVAASEQELAATKKKLAQMQSRMNTISEQAGISSTNISAYNPDIYFVQCEVVVGGKSWGGWSGTGFLLDNGCFVTAQHMIHFDYLTTDSTGNIVTDALATQLNSLYYAGQATIRMTCKSTQKSFSLEYTYTDMPFSLGEVEFKRMKCQFEDGTTRILGEHSYVSGGDWACVQLNQQGCIPFDAAFSRNMPAQTRLTIAGFPSNQGHSSPVVSEAITSRNGLESDGSIKTSNDNADTGNSGGPVFAVKDGKYVAVGVYSGVIFGSDRSHRKGCVVPIGAFLK